MSYISDGEELVSAEYLKNREIVIQTMLQLRVQGEQSVEKMAKEAAVRLGPEGFVSVSFVREMLGTIDAFKQYIIQGKATGTYNRVKLARDAGVSVGVMKLVEQELMPKLETPEFMRKITHLQQLLLEHCESQRQVCELDKARQRFEFGAYDASFEYYAREAGATRKKCKAESSIDAETVTIFFRQVQYCLWVGPKHCNSEEAKPTSYFLTKPFPNPEQLSQILDLMMPKDYKPSTTFRESQIAELTSLMICLYEGDTNEAVDSIMQCRSYALMRDLIDGTICDSGPESLRTLEACVGQEAVMSLCGESGELTACLSM